jgi:outer membrane protein assembly factor BamB
MRVVYVSLLLTGLFSVSAVAQEWPRFRGPNGSGLGVADLPVTWTEKDYRWKVQLPGRGHSSPVLWGERIFITSAEAASGKRLVLCLNAGDGRILWSRDFTGQTFHTHKRNSFATATPAVDAQHVYVPWATPQQYTVMALDHNGNLAWQTDLGSYKSQHGFGVSPIVFEDLVIAANEYDGGGALVALEGPTGKVRWRLPRHGKNATYSTPCVYQPPGRAPELIFTNWQHGITAVNPHTGKVNWETSVFDTHKAERAIASPVVAGDLVLGTCGFVTAQKHFVAVRPADPAIGAAAKEVWRLERAVSYLPTPLVKGDLVFLCSERGIATCLRAATGKVVWQERIDGEFSASPVCDGQRLYCVSNDGDVFVLAASEHFQLLARNALGEPTQSTPALAGGRLYFRTQSHLICLGGSPRR